MPNLPRSQLQPLPEFKSTATSRPNRKIRVRLVAFVLE